MTVKNEENIDVLKEEIQALRKQMESLAKAVEKNASGRAEAMTEGLQGEIDKYQKLAAEKLQKALDSGSDGIENISERIRQNPLGSLLLAFGAGYVISRIFRQDR
ncbi:MAG: hypothetical protein PHI96_01215 [Desulfovibrio sp.]|nr:hypothetical protein [Desulfovibrio sp.]